MQAGSCLRDLEMLSQLSPTLIVREEITEVISHHSSYALLHYPPGVETPHSQCNASGASRAGQNGQDPRHLPRHLPCPRGGRPCGSIHVVLLSMVLSHVVLALTQTVLPASCVSLVK